MRAAINKYINTTTTEVFFLACIEEDYYCLQLCCICTSIVERLCDKSFERLIISTDCGRTLRWQMLNKIIVGEKKVFPSLGDVQRRMAPQRME